MKKIVYPLILCFAMLSFRSLAQVPPVPTNVTVMGVSPESIRVSFTDNCDFENVFHVQYATSPDGPFSTDGIFTLGTTFGGTVMFDFELFTPNTTVYVKVSASVMVDGVLTDGPSSEVVSATTLSADNIPAPPSDFAGVPKEHRVLLSWTDQSDNEYGFVITRQQAGDPVTFNIPTNETSFIDSFYVTLEDEYHYTIQSVNEFGYGGEEVTTSVIRHLPPAPAAPININALGVSPSDIRVMFTDASDSESGFEISYSTSLDPFGDDWFTTEALPGTGNTSSTNFSVDVEPNTIVYVRARSFIIDPELDDPIYSPYTEIVSDTTLSGYPGPPSNFRAEQELKSVLLGWDDAADEAGYLIMRSDDGGNFNKVFNLPANEIDFRDTSVEYNATYTYRIESVNEFGYGSDILQLSITVLAPPVYVTAATGPLTSILATFIDNNDHETGYEVQSTHVPDWSTFDRFVAPPAATGDTVRVSVTGYGHNQQVYIRVAPFITKSGEKIYGPTSHVVSAVTDDYPLPPSDLTAAAEGNALRLTWSDNSNNEAAYIMVRYQGEYNPNIHSPFRLPPNTTTYLDTGVLPNVEYTYRVQSIDIYEDVPFHYFFTEGRFVEESFALEEMLVAPEILEAKPDGNGVTVTYRDTNTAETGYEIHYSTVSPDGPFTPQWVSDALPGTGTTNTVTESFSANTVVYVKARAVALLEESGDTLAGAFSPVYVVMTDDFLEQKIYFATLSGFYYLNKDGTGLTQATSQGVQMMQAFNGDLYGINKQNYDGLGDGGVFRVNAAGAEQIINFNYAESNGASVIQGTDGYFYGASRSAGCNTFKPSLFIFRPDGSEYRSLCNINHFAPEDELVRTQQGEIFGVSSDGGTDGKGFIYKILPGLTGFESIHSFSTPQGKRPRGRLMQGQDGYLYGTTESGGNANYGVIFKIQPSGQNFAVIHHFQKKNGGAYPMSGLVQDGEGFIYGITSLGGPNAAGVIFRINPDGSEYTVLHTMDGVNGRADFGTTLAIDSEGDLYGALRLVGGNTDGAIYKIKRDGTGYEEIVIFANDTSMPSGSFLLTQEIYEPIIKVVDPEHAATGVDVSPDLLVNEVSNALNYTVELSENANFSTIDFTATSEDTLLHVDGLKPETLYYTRAKSSVWPYFGQITSFTTGEAHQLRLWGNLTGLDGSIYHINLDGSDYVTAFDTRDDDPDFQGQPVNITQLSDGSIIGSTSEGGSEDWGNLFKIDSQGLTNIHDWEAYTYGNNVFFTEGDDGLIHGAGITVNMNGGRILTATPDGDDFQTRVFGKYGFEPAGYLTKASNGNIYGMSIGNGPGWIYKIKSDNSGVDQLFTFSTPTGKYPSGELTEGPDGFLYGMVTAGGAHYDGTVFKISLDAQQFIKLHDFDGTEGAHPLGGLIFDDTGTLYGVTSKGGEHDKGVVYKMNIDGTGFEVLHSNDQGTGLEGHLVLDEDQNLYGTGIGDSGMLFALHTDGTGYHVLVNFPAEDISVPQGRLLLIDESFNPGQDQNVITPAATRVAQNAEKTEQEEEKTVMVFPNPSAADFSVEVRSEQREAIELGVFDMKGMTMHQAEGFTNQPAVLGRELKAGVYILRVTNGSKIFYRRIVKQ